MRRRSAVLPLCAALAVLAAQPIDAARAADWPGEAPLRGSFEPPASAGSSGIRWDGINFGGSLGVMNMNADFGQAAGPLVNSIITNSTLQTEANPASWIVAPNETVNGRQYGGFVGYNLQWDDVVVGVDLGYNKTSGLEASAIGSINRVVTTSDGTSHNVSINSVSSIKLIDYATLRFRGGFSFGQFMPYAFIGGAVGRFNYDNSATVRDIQTANGATSTFGPVTASDSKDNAYLGGFTGGLGIDVAILPNLFLRAEYEFLGFAKLNGITTAVSTGRVGVGLRF